MVSAALTGKLDEIVHPASHIRIDVLDKVPDAGPVLDPRATWTTATRTTPKRASSRSCSGRTSRSSATFQARSRRRDLGPSPERFHPSDAGIRPARVAVRRRGRLLERSLRNAMGNVTDTGTSRPHRFGRSASTWLPDRGGAVLCQPAFYNLYDEAPEPAGDSSRWAHRLVRARVGGGAGLFGARGPSGGLAPTPRPSTFPPRSPLPRQDRDLLVARLRPAGFNRSGSSTSLLEIHLDILTYWVVIGLVNGANHDSGSEREREAARLALQASQLETRLARAQLDSEDAAPAALPLQHPSFRLRVDPRRR